MKADLPAAFDILLLFWGLEVLMAFEKRPLSWKNTLVRDAFFVLSHTRSEQISEMFNLFLKGNDEGDAKSVEEAASVETPPGLSKEEVSLRDLLYADCADEDW